MVGMIVFRTDICVFKNCCI